jgi:ubiquinone/menaquinone biosynthesis C-methylase UbiE
MTVDGWLGATRESYDGAAESYAERVPGALGRDPHLRAALAVFAEEVRGGPALDAGCGPGHVTGHLAGLGVEVVGIDLSPGMIGVARREHPGLRFAVGSMTDLPVADAALGGVLAWWSLIHVPDEAVPGVFAEFRRVLRPGAPVQLGFHVGTTARLKTEGYGGHPMHVVVHRRRPDVVADWLRAAGFAIEAEWRCDPDEPVPQAFLFARRRP